MELILPGRGRITGTTALAGAALVALLLAPAALAAAPKTLSAKLRDATFTTTYALSSDGGRLNWKLDGRRYGDKRIAVRLIVPYQGKPVALTLCTACRSVEAGQAVVAKPIAIEIAAGRADVMVTDKIEVQWQAARNPKLCAAMKGAFNLTEKAYVMPRDDALLEAVDDWLDKIEADGTLKATFDKYLKKPQSAAVDDAARKPRAPAAD